jgi:formyl-CoA transferase
MFGLIEGWTSGRTKWEVLDLLNARDIPCGPILSTKELIEDETLAELGSVVEVDHPVRGRFKTVGCPLRLSDSPVEVAPPPLLGEHTDEVLASLGYLPGQIEELRESGAI